MFAPEGFMTWAQARYEITKNASVRDWKLVSISPWEHLLELSIEYLVAKKNLWVVSEDGRSFQIDEGLLDGFIFPWEYEDDLSEEQESILEITRPKSHSQVARELFGRETVPRPKLRPYFAYNIGIISYRKFEVLKEFATSHFLYSFFYEASGFSVENNEMGIIAKKFDGWAICAKEFVVEAKIALEAERKLKDTRELELNFATEIITLYENGKITKKIRCRGSNA